MGNDLTNEDESDKVEDVQNEEIKYGIISKKCEEKSNNDRYIISPNIKHSEGDKSIEYSLFGIFDGHNSNYISQYLSENINKFFEKEIYNINDKNYKTKIEEIFIEIDKALRKLQICDKDDKNDINFVDVEVNEKEKEKIKNSIKKSKDISDDFKEIDDDELENLLLFKNMFNYNNNFFNIKNNLNYIGSSASLVLINQDNIITIQLGVTKCFLFDKKGTILNKKSKIEEGNNEYSKEHIFSNDNEKRRIKKFNKDIDYESLIINPYIKCSRSFGFFKYKENKLLNEENQIISCVPDIEIYDKKNIRFIFFITGLEIGPNSQKKLSEEISNLNEKQDEQKKYSKLIEKLLKYFQKEKSKVKNLETDNTKKNIWKNNFNLYFGNDNLNDENIFINELDEDYYKDIIDLNNKDIPEKRNITCILIKLNESKDDNIDKDIENKDKENEEKEKKEKEKKGKKEEEKKENKEKEKKEKKEKEKKENKEKEKKGKENKDKGKNKEDNTISENIDNKDELNEEAEEDDYED